MCLKRLAHRCLRGAAFGIVGNRLHIGVYTGKDIFAVIAGVEQTGDGVENRLCRLRNRGGTFGGIVGARQVAQKVLRVLDDRAGSGLRRIHALLHQLVHVCKHAQAIIFLAQRYGLTRLGAKRQTNIEHGSRGRFLLRLQHFGLVLRHKGSQG